MRKLVSLFTLFSLLLTPIAMASQGGDDADSTDDSTEVEVEVEDQDATTTDDSSDSEDEEDSGSEVKVETRERVKANSAGATEIRTRIEEAVQARQEEMKSVFEERRVQFEEAVQARREAFEGNREEAKQELERIRSEFKQKLEDGREEAKQKMEQAREEFKNRIQEFSQERQDKMNSIFTRLDEVNAKVVANLSESLEKLAAILENVNDKIDTLEADGIDVSDLVTASTQAQASIDAAQTALAEQAAKTYDIDIENEEDAKEAAKVSRDELRADLDAVARFIKSAREDVRTVASDLADYTDTDDDADSIDT